MMIAEPKECWLLRLASQQRWVCFSQWMKFALFFAPPTARARQERGDQGEQRLRPTDADWNFAIEVLKKPSAKQQLRVLFFFTFFFFLFLTWGTRFLAG